MSRVSSQGPLTSSRYVLTIVASRVACDRLGSSDSRNLHLDLSTGFEGEWEPAGQELEVELELERGRDREEGREEVTTGPGSTGTS